MFKKQQKEWCFFLPQKTEGQIVDKCSAEIKAQIKTRGEAQDKISVEL